MTLHDSINREYFTWLCDIVCSGRNSDQISYTKLLTYLHDTEFRYVIQRDRNRAEDGIELRHRFAYEFGYSERMEVHLEKPCSILEMMVSLALRCEENIMDDDRYGNRTGQWFWNMIGSMGLGHMMDIRFDKWLVERVLSDFVNREYKPNGEGGLFTLRDCPDDLRTVEIWIQMCWYLENYR